MKQDSKLVATTETSESSVAVQQTAPARRRVLTASVLAGATATAALWASARRDKAQPAATTETDDPAGMFLVPGSRHSDAIPDVPLLTQTGQTVRLYSDLIRDQRVLISFMYCRCQGICPASSGLMQRLRKILPQYLGPDLRLLSLTLDPEHDTPRELQRYARAFGSGDDQTTTPWTFLTGGAQQIESVRTALGYRDPDPVIDADRTQHAAMLTFGNDAANRWGTLPVGLTELQTVSGILRVLGNSTAERFAVVPRPV